MNNIDPLILGITCYSLASLPLNYGSAIFFYIIWIAYCGMLSIIIIGNIISRKSKNQ